jgi:hypothetical protein
LHRDGSLLNVSIRWRNENKPRVSRRCAAQKKDSSAVLADAPENNASVAIPARAESFARRLIIEAAIGPTGRRIHKRALRRFVLFAIGLPKARSCA